jgi:hypothetical protein
MEHKLTELKKREDGSEKKTDWPSVYDKLALVYPGYPKGALISILRFRRNDERATKGSADVPICTPTELHKGFALLHIPTRTTTS